MFLMHINAFVKFHSENSICHCIVNKSEWRNQVPVLSLFFSFEQLYANLSETFTKHDLNMGAW